MRSPRSSIRPSKASPRVPAATPMIAMIATTINAYSTVETPRWLRVKRRPLDAGEIPETLDTIHGKTPR